MKLRNGKCANYQASNQWNFVNKTIFIFVFQNNEYTNLYQVIIFYSPNNDANLVWLNFYQVVR